jgi:hypothetical protein
MYQKRIFPLHLFCIIYRLENMHLYNLSHAEEKSICVFCNVAD